MLRLLCSRFEETVDGKNPKSSPSQGVALLKAFSTSESSSGIPGCFGNLGLKKGGGHMKKGDTTGSISQIETRLGRSPAVDSSQPT